MLRKRLLPLLCALLLLAGCGTTQQNTPAEVSFFAMDTYMNLRAYGADEALLREAEEAIYALEARLSTTRPGSKVYIADHTGAADLSPDTETVLRRALAVCAETGGALDVTVYPVVRAWGFTTEAYRVPEAAELTALLAGVDYRLVEIDDGRVTLPAGTELDLGAVAKGYAGELLRGLLQERGVTSAVLDLGGSVQTVGEKPDGTAWHVGIRDPEGEGLLGVLEVRDRAVITSGGYERYFEDEEGNLWWHIMDPATGYPARSGLTSVTVVGEDGLRCDGLSTALFVLGEEGAIALWRQAGDFEMALVTEDGRLLLTPALMEVFTPDPALGYTLEVIGDA